MKKVTFNLYMDKEEGKFNLVLTAENSAEQGCCTIRNYEHIDFENVCKILSIRNKGITLPDDGFSSWAQEADKIRISLKNRGAKLAAFIHEVVEASKRIERVKRMIECEIYPELSGKYNHFSINDIV